MSDDTTIINGGNATIQHNITYASQERAIAVGIALELIKQASIGATRGQIRDMLDELDSWADKIQEAVRKNS